MPILSDFMVLCQKTVEGVQVSHGHKWWENGALDGLAGRCGPCTGPTVAQRELSWKAEALSTFQPSSVVMSFVNKRMIADTSGQNELLQSSGDP